MQFADFHIDPELPLLALAVHNGHDLRQQTSGLMALDDSTRLREEDPYTGDLAKGLESWVVANRSRFEVDLNRPRSEAIYQTPDDAWGLNLWSRELGNETVTQSLELYDSFYERLGEAADLLVEKHGGFVLYDIHSYNHRRQGPDGPPEPQADNPDINLGTGTLPEKWDPVAATFLEFGLVAGFDARENVKFMGRRVAEWVHQNYGDVACALAIEFKKNFMDEWTGELDGQAFERIGSFLESSVEPVMKMWRSCR